MKIKNSHRDHLRTQGTFFTVALETTYPRSK